MSKIHRKNLNSPDETKSFDKAMVDLVTLEGITFGRGTFQPGWKWSTSVKPIVKTDSCESLHTQYVVSGRMMVKMDDGEELEFGPGDAAIVPPGHDMWVIGSEPVVMIDVIGITHAKS